MKERFYYLFIFFFLLSFSSWAGSVIQENNTYYFQPKKYKSLSLITGFQSGFHNFAEIGIGIKNDVIGLPHPSTSIIAISNEFRYDNNFVWGMKFGAWSGGGVGGTNIGINLINYTDFKENAIRFRPEIGLGFGGFRMVYGYNFSLVNKEFDKINSHLFGIHLLFDLKKLQEVKLY